MAALLFSWRSACILFFILYESCIEGAAILSQSASSSCDAKNRDPCSTFPSLCSEGGGLCVWKGPCEYECVCPPDGRRGRDCTGRDDAIVSNGSPVSEDGKSPKFPNTLLVFPQDTIFWDMDSDTNTKTGQAGHASNFSDGTLNSRAGPPAPSVLLDVLSTITPATTVNSTLKLIQSVTVLTSSASLYHTSTTYPPVTMSSSTLQSSLPTMVSSSTTTSSPLQSIAPTTKRTRAASISHSFPSSTRSSTVKITTISPLRSSTAPQLLLAPTSSVPRSLASSPRSKTLINNSKQLALSNQTSPTQQAQAVHDVEVSSTSLFSDNLPTNGTTSASISSQASSLSSTTSFPVISTRPLDVDFSRHQSQPTPGTLSISSELSTMSPVTTPFRSTPATNTPNILQITRTLPTTRTAPTRPLQKFPTNNETTKSSVSLSEQMTTQSRPREVFSTTSSTTTQQTAVSSTTTAASTLPPNTLYAPRKSSSSNFHNPTLESDQINESPKYNETENPGEQLSTAVPTIREQRKETPTSFKLMSTSELPIPASLKPVVEPPTIHHATSPKNPKTTLPTPIAEKLKSARSSSILRIKSTATETTTITPVQIKSSSTATDAGLPTNTYNEMFIYPSVMQREKNLKNFQKIQRSSSLLPIDSVVSAATRTKSSPVTSLLSTATTPTSNPQTSLMLSHVLLTTTKPAIEQHSNTSASQDHTKSTFQRPMNILAGSSETQVLQTFSVVSPAPTSKEQYPTSKVLGLNFSTTPISKLPISPIRKPPTLTDDSSTFPEESFSSVGNDIYLNENLNNNSLTENKITLFNISHNHFNATERLNNDNDDTQALEDNDDMFVDFVLSNVRGEKVNDTTLSSNKHTSHKSNIEFHFNSKDFENSQASKANKTIDSVVTVSSFPFHKMNYSSNNTKEDPLDETSEFKYTERNGILKVHNIQKVSNENETNIDVISNLNNATSKDLFDHLDKNDSNKDLVDTYDDVEDESFSNISSVLLLNFLELNGTNHSFVSVAGIKINHTIDESKVDESNIIKKDVFINFSRELDEREKFGDNIQSNGSYDMTTPDRGNTVAENSTVGDINIGLNLKFEAYGLYNESIDILPETDMGDEITISVVSDFNNKTIKDDKSEDANYMTDINGFRRNITEFQHAFEITSTSNDSQKDVDRIRPENKKQIENLNRLQYNETLNPKNEMAHQKGSSRTGNMTFTSLLKENKTEKTTPNASVFTDEPTVSKSNVAIKNRKIEGIKDSKTRSAMSAFAALLSSSLRMSKSRILVPQNTRSRKSHGSRDQSKGIGQMGTDRIKETSNLSPNLGLHSNKDQLPRPISQPYQNH